MHARLLLAVCTLAFTAVLATPAVSYAQNLDSPKRKELKRLDLPEAPNMEIVSSVTEYQPGEGIPRHLHHGIETGYVVQGTMIQVAGKAPTMFATGTPILNQREVAHGGFTVVGPGSLILYTVHIVEKGKPLYDVAK